MYVQMEREAERVCRRQIVDLNADAMDEDYDIFEYINPEEYSKGEGINGIAEARNRSWAERHKDIRFDEIGSEEVHGMMFDTTKEAEWFYMMYARATGFGVRKGYKRKDPSGCIRIRAWLCNREGERDPKHVNRVDRIREAKAQTRVNCQACLKIRYDRTMKKYIVSSFVSQHSHRLCSPGSIQFIRSHRKVGEADCAQAELMRQAGVKRSHILRLMALEAGGYQNMHFNEKDLHNKLNARRQTEIVGGDAESAIAYLAGKQDSDINLYYKYAVDEEGRLTRLLWADSRARDDYRCFGDVLVFDSTYNSNHYQYPLVVLCGVNNHYSTCIFSCAVMVGEGEDAYDWVISTFLEAMDGKQPISIVTDGDKAMRKAIKKLLPNSKHRLCSFHLERNANSNVRDKEFLKPFKSCMFMNATPEQFEAKWAEVVTRFGLKDNEWVNKMHKRKELWAMAFLRGNFFAGMRSTQRCEKMNQVLKLHLTPEVKLYEAVRAYELAVARLRHEERKNRAVTEHTTLLPGSQLHAIERNAADVYTRNTFILVREEMRKQGLYCRYYGSNDGISSIHYIRHPYSHAQYKVVYNMSLGHMYCSCFKMETHGLPCCHMFRAMLFEELKRIPENCILKRWTRRAKEGMLSNEAADTIDTSLIEMARYSRLVTGFRNLCQYASKTKEGYANVLDVFENETVRAKELYLKRQAECGTLSGTGDGRAKRRRVGVLDPQITRKKGSNKAKGKQHGEANRGLQAKQFSRRTSHAGHSESCIGEVEFMESDDEAYPGSQIMSQPTNNSSIARFAVRESSTNVHSGTVFGGSQTWPNSAEGCAGQLHPCSTYSQVGSVYWAGTETPASGLAYDEAEW